MNEHSSPSMEFEMAMMQFFGEKAHLIASYANNNQLRKKWLLKAVKIMLKKVDEIDTTTRHKKMLLSEIEDLLVKIKKANNAWAIIYRLFSLCSRFIGYDYLKGGIYNTPILSSKQRTILHSKNI